MNGWIDEWMKNKKERLGDMWMGRLTDPLTGGRTDI